MNPFSISGLLTVVSSLGFGLFVLLKSRDRKIGRIWFVFTLLVAVWGFGAFWLGAAKSATEGLLAARLAYAFGVLWIAAVFYHFVCTFLELDHRNSIIINYLIAAVFLPALPTRFFFKRADFMWGSMFYMRSGAIHFLFFAWWAGLVIYSHYLLFNAYRQVSSTQKTQIKYFFLAMAIGFSGGSLCYLPNFGIDLYPWGNFAVIFYPIIVSYAILKHQLMNINVVIRKTLIYSFVSTVLISVYVGAVTLLARFLENQAAASVLLPSGIFRWFGKNMAVAFPYSCVATALFSAGLGIFVWLQGLRHPVHRLWMFFCVAVGFWSLGTGLMVWSPTFARAFLFEKWIVQPGSITIPVLFLHFVMLITEIRPAYILKIGYSMAACFEIANVLGYLVSVKVCPPFNYYTAPYGSFLIYLAYFFSLVIYAHVLLIQKIWTADEQLRNQLKFVFLGTSIGFCGGSTVFFLMYGIQIPPYGVYAVPLYIVTASYAIFKHQLMDINVVIRKTLVYSLLSAALAAVYVGTITLLVHVLGGRKGSASAVSSALAAIFITLLFNPVRIRIQRFVDRHFSREAVDKTVLREITSAFVHEIKMPLTSIALPAELTIMDMQDLESGRVSASEVVPKIKKRMKHIIDQAMLANRRVEAIGEVTGRQKMLRDLIDPTDIVKRSLKQVEAIVRRSKTRIQLRLHANLPSISGDIRQLEIVIVNLLKNAVEAMRQQKTRNIGIEACAENGHVIVSITDSGPGIKPEDAGRIFRPHYTTKGADGTGMGLYLSREIIEVHGGTLEVAAPNGGGATFTIKLPKAS